MSSGGSEPYDPVIEIGPLGFRGKVIAGSKHSVRCDGAEERMANSRRNNKHAGSLAHFRTPKRRKARRLFVLLASSRDQPRIHLRPLVLSSGSTLLELTYSLLFGI